MFLTPKTTYFQLISFDNLHPYYTYQCTVAAYTVGVGPYTLPITVQLDPEGKLLLHSSIRFTTLQTV